MLWHSLHYPGCCTSMGLSHFWAMAWPNCICRQTWKFQIHLLCLKHEHGFQTLGEHVVRVKRQLGDKSYCKNIFSAYELACPACLCTYTYAYSQLLLLQAVNILPKASALTSSTGTRQDEPPVNGGALPHCWCHFGGSAVTVTAGWQLTLRLLALSICFWAPCFIQAASLGEEERLNISLLHGKLPFAFFN